MARMRLVPAEPGRRERAVRGRWRPTPWSTRLHRAGARGVVLKQGADGCVVSDGTRRERIAAHRVASVDATGAGDCFDGAFAARLLAGDDPFAAARYANVAAALATDRLRRRRAAAARGATSTRLLRGRRNA